MHRIYLALRSVYAKPYAWILSVSVSASVLFVYYIIFLQTTTWSRFLDTDIPLYVWSQILLSLANAIAIGIAMSMFLAVFEIKQKAGKATLLTAGSLLFSAAATGCPVCGAFLLPLIGVSSSLAALPLGGIDVKILSLVVLLYTMYEYAKTLTGVCPVSKEKLIAIKNGKLTFHITRQTLAEQKPLAIMLLFIIAVYSLPALPKQWRVDFQKTAPSNKQTVLATTINEADLQKEINPSEGYEIKATYGDLGPQLLKIGIISVVKFQAVFNTYNEPLTQEQLDILTKGSDAPIRITAANAHFLLDLFWAVGLTNSSKILTQGPMVQYGQNQLGNFASTGNWVIGEKDAMNYYANAQIIPLTTEQENLVEKVASNIYRPCCGNPAFFPDCNHGMAMLGMLELMAANGATETDMYTAAKYVNAYWFPMEYYQLAAYFKQTQGKDFTDVDPKLLLSKDYSSVFGIQNIQQWLKDNNVHITPPQDKVGCGV